MWNRLVPRRYVAWRAQRYADPVDRLKYLRRAGAVSPALGAKKLLRMRWTRLAPFGFVVLLMIPLPTISDVALFRDMPALAVEPRPADAARPSRGLVSPGFTSMGR